MNKLTEVNNHEQVFSKLWTECQHCQVMVSFTVLQVIIDMFCFDIHT
jgi:hypothetical protein